MLYRGGRIRIWSEEKAEIRKEKSGTYKGLIAQQLEEVFPEWVSEDEDGYKIINTEELPFVLIEAVKELKQEKDAEIETLHSTVDKLQRQVEELSAAMQGKGLVNKARRWFG